MTKNKTLILLIILVVCIGATYGIYRYKNASQDSQASFQAEDKSFIQGQNQVTEADKQEIAKIESQPLLQEIPYLDDVIFVDTTDESTHIGVQYAGSLESAKSRYKALLKHFKDSGKDYKVVFQKVDALPTADSVY